MNGDQNPVSFVDTNIFIYALDQSDPIRREAAQTLLQESYVTATRKIKTPIPPADALRYLDQIASFPVYSPGLRWGPGGN